MSWDLFIMNLPKGIKSADDIPETFKPNPLGSQKKVVTTIRTVFPDLVFDHGFVAVDVPDGSIEIDIGADDPVESVMLAVRGGPGVLKPVTALVNALGGQAADSWSETGLFDPKQAAESLTALNTEVKKLTKKKKK